MNIQPVLIVHFILGIVSIEIPKKGWISEEIGVLIEPSNLIIHYDSVVYNTIGIKLSPVPTLEQLNSSVPNGCSLGPERLNVLKKMNESVKNFFHTIPKHFADFSNHYCKDGTIDCFLSIDSNNNSVSGRDKRQIAAAVIAVAGLAAVGTGLYHVLSENELKNHLSELDRQITTTDRWMTKEAEDLNQYQKLSEDMYTKLYNGVINNERLLASSICKVQSDNIYSQTYLEYSLVLEAYKEQFLLAMDGKVSDFLFSYDFLIDTILSKPDFKDTAYKVDPGLFYLASTGMLTRVDYANYIAYFTVTTPILHEVDVSPLYRVYNLGWWGDGYSSRLSLPEHIYFLTDSTEVRVASPDLDKCRKHRGTFLCNLRDSHFDKKSICANELLIQGNRTSCSVITKREQERCSYEITRGGVFLLGCRRVFKLSTFRSIPEQTPIKVPANVTKFLPYTKFSQLSIEGNVVSSSGTYIVHKWNSFITRPSVDLTGLEHLILPGVDHDIDELRESRSRMRESTEGFLKDFLNQYQRSYSWVWYIFGVCSLINILIFTRACWMRCRVKRKTPQYTLEDVIEMQRSHRQYPE